MKRKSSLKEKGITLISLVVAIIIILILAGITLGTAIGKNGLIDKTKKAVSEYKEAEKDEENKIGLLSNMIKVSNSDEKVEVDAKDLSNLLKEIENLKAETSELNKKLENNLEIIWKNPDTIELDKYVFPEQTINLNLEGYKKIYIEFLTNSYSLEGRFFYTYILSEENKYISSLAFDSFNSSYNTLTVYQRPIEIYSNCIKFGKCEYNVEAANARALANHWFIPYKVYGEKY